MGWSGIKRNVTDSLFSDIVRKRAEYVCEWCKRDFKNRPDIFDCSHFITRGNKRLRWDFENASALCRGCHNYFGKNPDAHVVFMINKLGVKKYNSLRFRKERQLSDAKIDEKIVRMGLKAEWKRING